LYDHRSFGAAAQVALTDQSDPASSSGRSKPPNDIEALAPCISRGDLLITLTTPYSAFAPHTADAGPRITSTCFTSLKLSGRKSHITNPKKS
jgi:hypothetical protein